MHVLKRNYVDIEVVDVFFVTAVTSKRNPEKYLPPGWIQRNRLVMIPVLLRDHWSLVVLDVQNSTIRSLDSRAGKSRAPLFVWRYLLSTSWSKKKWKIEKFENIPQQNNGHDCGVFMLQFARSEANQRLPDFSQGDVSRIRKIMVHEILSGSLFEEP
ncbi:sentrin-specific protease-like isoform X2 [Mya arenaria]|nr:sentrin-specific protease-like isoform X2 [Mya arenaria]